MLKVKTTIGLSKVHGIGLFADQFIPKGTVTWQFDPEWDVVHTKDEINNLSEINKEYFLYYSYFDKKRNLYVLPVDHLKFINHTSNQNTLNIDSSPDQDVAKKDIQPGEEFLCDYNKFDDSYFKRMGLKNLV